MVRGSEEEVEGVAAEEFRAVSTLVLARVRATALALAGRQVWELRRVESEFRWATTQESQVQEQTQTMLAQFLAWVKKTDTRVEKFFVCQSPSMRHKKYSPQ